MIELNGEACVAGGKVSGTVSWPPAADAPAGPITLWLVWHLSIKERRMIESGSTVTEDYVVVSRSQHVAARSIAFDFSIPEEGPVSYAGRLFGVVWEIVVGTDGSSSGLTVKESLGFKVLPRPAALSLDA